MSVHTVPSEAPAQTVTVPVRQVRPASIQSLPDAVAIEEPLEIRLGVLQDGKRTRRSVSITMRTPGHDDELAVGFLHGEGLLRGPAEVGYAGPCPLVARGGRAPQGAGNVVRVDLAEGVTVDLSRLERHFYTTSSCGVCGKSSLEALAVKGLRPLPDGLRIQRDTLVTLPDQLRAAQAVFEQTGGLHAAALFDAGGRLRVLREDVGRHNALDKVIGRRLLDGALPARDHVLLLSGRTSFELVQKALVAGISVIAAVGAPSSLAVSVAEAYNITLIGFLRGARFNIYTGAHRVLGRAA